MEPKNPWVKTDIWEEEIALLRSIIDQTELVETTKWGGPVFTSNGKNILGIGGFKSYFGIWFFNGVFLKDEANVLVAAQEGVTKALRQWRFASKAEVEKNEKRILQYIAESVANEKAGMVFKPQKKETVVSKHLQTALNADANLATAFAGFSPFKQREFIEFLESAKREETKLSRLEKIKPLILANVGLNDKYR